jgi:hypothetical protein
VIFPHHLEDAVHEPMRQRPVPTDQREQPPKATLPGQELTFIGVLGGLYSLFRFLVRWTTGRKHESEIQNTVPNPVHDVLPHRSPLARLRTARRHVAIALRVQILYTSRFCIGKGRELSCARPLGQLAAALSHELMQ